MGGSPSPPSPPDPVKTAEAQGAMNKETAIAQARLNMVDQLGPLGSLRYEQIPGSTGTERAFDQSGYDAALQNWQQSGAGAGGQTIQEGQSVPWETSQGTTRGARPDRSEFYFQEETGTPRYRAITELSPEQQRQFELQQELAGGTSELALRQLGRIDESLGQPFSLEGLPEAPGAGGFSEDRQRVEDALYGAQSRYLDPQFETEQRRMETQLANMGITRGTEAFQREMDDFGRRRTGAYGDARDRAITAGGAEQSRLFGLSSNARERALQEMLLERSQPINEASALLGTGPGVQIPQFSPPPQTGIQPADYQGAVQNAYQGELANWQAKQQGSNALMGSLFGLGGSIAGGLAGGPAGAAAGGWLFG